MTVTIYHNARCSKSRATLALLQEKGMTPTIVAYLDTPPDVATIRDLLNKLGFSDARQLMRQGEAEYQELHLADPALSQDTLIAAMLTHPRLIERPIVVHNDQAAIGRPPENVLAIL
nr:arsenate reductase (glutaredoxin) [uncultured Rhodoferax sp.]